MATKNLDAYKLAVVLDAAGAAKGISALADADKKATKLDASFVNLGKAAVRGFGDIKKAATDNAQRTQQALAGALAAGKKNLGGLISEAKKAQAEFRALEKAEERALRLASGGFFSRISARAGSVLPGLSHISNIIQGLPQIGGLAGALVSPLTEAAEAGVRFNDFLETTEVGLTKTLFGGARDKARAYLKELRDFAGVTPFRTEPLIKIAQYASVVTFKAHEIKGLLTDVGDTIAATGEISEDSVKSVVRAFGKIRGEGRVTAEAMEMLTDAGVNGWEMLAHAIGKSVAETRKLSETGKLNGPGAVEAIRAEMRARYGGMMDELQNTGTGRKSAAEDALQSAQAKATEALTKDINTTLGAALLQTNLVDRLAGTVNSAIAPVSGLIRTAAVGLLGGGITSGLKEGIEAGRSLVGSAVKDFALDTLIGGFKSWLGINSPAKTMIPLGHSMAEGIAVGLDEGVDLFSAQMMGSVDRLIGNIESFANGRGGRRRLSTQQVNRQRLEQIAAQEPGFLDALKRGSAQRGINPDDFLNLMAVESSFRKSVLNKWGYLGLGQVGRDERQQLGLPRGDREAQGLFERNSYTWQLENVLFPFYDIKNRVSRRQGHGNLSDLSEMYAAWGSGHSKGDPNAVHATRGGRRASMYRNNPAWDPNRDGRIQEYEFGVAARAALGAGVSFTVNGGPVSNVNPVPVVIARGDLTGGVGVFAAQSPYGGRGGGGEWGEVASPAEVAPLATAHAAVEVLEEVRTDLSGVHLSLVELPQATTSAGIAMGVVERDARRAAEGMKGGAVAAGQFAKLVIGSGESVAKRLTAAFNSLGAMIPGQQVGKKRGFLSKMLGFAAPFLNFIPGVGPILSTLAGIGSSVLGGDYGSAFTQGVPGFSSGGAFRRGSSSSGGSTAGGTSSDPGVGAGLEPRANGGPVRKGRAYTVGDRGPRQYWEVFEPETDGYVYPSVEAYEGSRRGSSSAGGGHKGGGVMGGALASVLNKMEAHFARLETVSPEHVFTTGAKRNPGAVTDAFMRGASRDPKVIEWMERRRAA